ncbi:flavodoxin family protein [Nocardia stercoris]|uniref:Flavodoxin n=1 Tax=Nocardia stercoris TaxID=2483361 RepID=A0A3M2LFG0_9NOCA|nr:flavodoxin family protein [Nocardia stercoris]RMI33418.1 flavodoxin [Nocardia stercoris]
MPKAIIVCKSVSHGNTRKVAAVIGEVLGARVVDPADIQASDLTGYDLVGFGSGIFTGHFHQELREFVRSLPSGQAGAAFVFATSGFPDSGLTRFSRPLVKLVEEKGFRVIGTFSCRAFDTFAPFAIAGGIRKGRPDATDLDAARTFATTLRTRPATS